MNLLNKKDSIIGLEKSLNKDRLKLRELKFEKTIFEILLAYG